MLSPIDNISDDDSGEAGRQVGVAGSETISIYMRGIKATNLEYKESLVQVELKIDLSKLRH